MLIPVRVYRGVNIGAAKPAATCNSKVPLSALISATGNSDGGGLPATSPTLTLEFSNEVPLLVRGTGYISIQ